MFRQFFRDRRGNVAILSAVMIVSLVGISGLVVEYGNGLLNRMQDQRIADVAATGGGTVYNSTSSTMAMNAAVANIAALNGLPSGNAVASLVSSPSGDGNQAVEVTVSTSVPLVLSRVLRSNSTLPISVSSYAELKAGAPACIIALSGGGTGVTLSGGTAVTAASCAVASDNSVSVPCGTTITTQNVDYDKAAPSEPCNGIQPPTGKTLTLAKTVTSDPLAGTSEVTGATGRLATVAALTSPSGPSGMGSGTAVTFGYSQTTTKNEVAADGCTASFASNTWTVVCSGSGPYNFGAISLSGGITVNFNTGGSSSTTYNFSGQIDDSGTALKFGPGTYNIANGVLSGGGSTTTFGAGAFTIGKNTGSCNGTTNYSICNTGTLMTFGGPSTFVLAGGVYNKGGETLTLGSGTGNSFDIGTFANGDSFEMGGGANTTFADAMGKTFEMAGNLNVGSGGGSCLSLGASSEHDINGFMTTAGGNILGAGIYTVTKYAWLGGNGGGDVTCWGSTVGMNGTDVTIVIGGASVATSGGCPNEAFCVKAGYSDVTLSAPTSGNTQGLAVIGPTTSSNTAQAVFAEGASNTTVSGAFYFPYGAVSLSGAATVGDGTGQCLELIGSQVTLSGGSAVASSCNIPGAGISDIGTVALVQ